MLGLAAAARGAPFLARGVVSSRRKTSRVVIARTIIDGSTSDMMESSGVSDSKLARRLTGKATSWACAEPVVPHAPAATKRTSPRMRCSARHFVKTSTMSRPGTYWIAGVGLVQHDGAEHKKPLTWPREQGRATRPGAWAGVTSLGGNQARITKQYSGQS